MFWTTKTESIGKITEVEIKFSIEASLKSRRIDLIVVLNFDILLKSIRILVYK